MSTATPSEAGVSVRSSSMMNGDTAASSRTRQSSIAASTRRQSSIAQGSQSSRVADSEVGFNILKPDTSGLDEGLITEIAKLREFMRKEEQARLGIKSASTRDGQEETPPDRISHADTTLDKDSCMYEYSYQWCMY